MNFQTKNYCQSMVSHPEQNRQVIMLMLVSRFALILFIGVIYAGIRFIG